MNLTLIGMTQALVATHDPEVAAVSFPTPGKAVPDLAAVLDQRVTVVESQHILVLELKDAADKAEPPTATVSLQDRVRAARVQLRRARAGADVLRVATQKKAATDLKKALFP